MRLPKLDMRLAAIREMLDGAASMCDIGADHGKLALRLAKDGVKVIATDISEPSLKKTLRLAGLHKADIDCRLGNGLEVIHPGEVNAAVMAGMGQNTIIDIIKSGRSVADKCDFIVMQPMNGEYDLRSYISHEGFEIAEEAFVKEGRRVYCVIKMRPRGGRRLTELEKHIGPVTSDKRGDFFKEYLLNKIEILSDIISGMESAGDTQTERYSGIKDALEKMKVMV